MGIAQLPSFLLAICIILTLPCLSRASPFLWAGLSRLHPQRFSQCLAYSSRWTELQL